MNEIFHQILVGLGSVILAPTDAFPRPEIRITLPPENSAQAIGFDFSHVCGDLKRSISKIEHKDQLELALKCESDPS
ncbi:MAG: hypothetical protein HY043_10595 [Verrucomicrobia bacterium]|nr:hypothetical protein [Verrucomicrobiota bacterium]